MTLENSPDSEKTVNNEQDNIITCDKCYTQSSDKAYFLTNIQEDTTYCIECGVKCDNCDDVVLKDEAHYLARDQIYCQSCFDDNYTHCPNCEEIVETEEYLPPTRRNSYKLKSGGCTRCSFNCDSCSRVVDNDEAYSHENEQYCEDCYSENFTSCEECGDTVAQDNAIYVDDYGSFCDSCYEDKFDTCFECDSITSKDNITEFDGQIYCKTCYEEVAQVNLEVFKDQIENLNQFSYTKKDRLLNSLSKIVPITVKDLKVKHPQLANGLSDFIKFIGGKPITHDLIAAYRQSLGAEEFPVEYSTWKDLQRSVESLEENPVKTSQLVLKIIASKELLNTLKENTSLYDLFDNVNNVSNKSTHPYSKDQVGWARLELDPNKEFILIDEIQCDHQNAAFKLKQASEHSDLGKVRALLKNKYKLDDDQFNLMLDKYSSLMKNFPDIATVAITNFAKKNGYKKLFWHEYESGKKLKGNAPPKSLYEKIPKEQFFSPTNEKPFGLDGQFFSREASKKLIIIARKIELKLLIK